MLRLGVKGENPSYYNNYQFFDGPYTEDEDDQCGESESAPLDQSRALSLDDSLLDGLDGIDELRAERDLSVSTTSAKASRRSRDALTSSITNQQVWQPSNEVEQPLSLDQLNELGRKALTTARIGLFVW